MTYQCFNREAFAPSISVQDGWETTWARRMVDVEFLMDQSCVYSTSDLGQADKQCTGCKWRIDDAARPPETPAVAHGGTVDGCIPEPLLEPSAGDSTRPGICGAAKPADSGDAEALEQKYPNAQIYRRAE